MTDILETFICDGKQLSPVYDPKDNLTIDEDVSFMFNESTLADEGLIPPARKIALKSPQPTSLHHLIIFWYCSAYVTIMVS